MLKRRFRVKQSFPVWWRKKEMGSGEYFELVAADVWHEVGGGFYRVDSPQTDKPDFSGIRLRFLLEYRYIEEI